METTNIRVISGRATSAEEERLQRFRVMLQQTGGDPSAILELLATIIRNKDWRSLSDQHDGSQTFLGYFRDLGWSKEDLIGFVETMHHRHERPPKLRPDIRDETVELRSRVRDLANPPLLPIGAPKGSANGPGGRAGKTEESPPIEGPGSQITNPSNRRVSSEDATTSSFGTTSSYLTSRLKRDAPALAEKVISGEMSPRAAAIQGGIITPEFSVPIEPQGAARRILKRFQGESLLELIRVLANHAGVEIVEPTGVQR